MIYTYYKSRGFFSCGDNPYISYPLHSYNSKGIKIGDNFICEKRVRLEVVDIHKNKYPLLKIGDNVHINWDCHIGVYNSVIIGDNVLIGSKVLIIDHSHGNLNQNENAIPVRNRSLVSKGEIIIGDNVWIGESVSILANVIIGDNCIIGANSVVTKSIPNNCIVAGNPAKVIRTL